MATKEQSIAAAKAALRQISTDQFTMEFAIYRVGGAWMHTTSSLEIVQAFYKVPVKDYQEIKLD